MKSQEKIRVKITKTNKWYKKDEIHEVLNYVTFAFVGGDPCYEKSNGSYGIHCADCEILTIPELSIT